MMAAANEIPADFLKIDELKIRHTYRFGQVRKYRWLQSDAYVAESFLNYIDLPCPRIRVMELYDPSEAFCRHFDAPGWEIMKNLALSPILSRLPNLDFSTDGGLLVFNEQVTAEDLCIASSDLSDVGSVQLDDLSLEQVQNFWDVINRLDPIFYVYQSEGTTLIAENDCIAGFIQTPEFTGISERRRESEIAARKNLLQGLGAEIGPEKCIQQGCIKLRIPLAVRCIEHHIIYGTGAEQRLGPECGPETCVEPDCERLRIKVAIRCIRHQQLHEWL